MAERSNDDIKAMSFETALNELEQIVGTLEGGKAPPPLPSTIGVLDYRIGEVAGLVWPNTLVDRAEPAVLAIIATAQTVDPGLRIVAAERAARLALVPPGVLGEQYRALPVSADDVANGLATRQTGAMRRAVLARTLSQGGTMIAAMTACAAMLFVMLGGVCMIGYNLGEKQHAEIRRQLDERDAQALYDEAPIVESVSAEASIATPPTGRA